MAELAVDEIVYQTWDCTIYDCQLWITSTIGRYTPTVKLVFQASIFRCYCWWFRNPKELPGMVIKPCKYWDKFPTDLNWCRIYSINSMLVSWRVSMISSRKHRILWKKTPVASLIFRFQNLLKQFEHLVFAYSMSKIAMKHLCQKHQRKRQGL